MSQGRERHPIHEVNPQRLLLWSVVVAVAFGWIFWDFLQRQFWFAIQQQADWGHTLVIPFISGYFIWLWKDQLLSKPFHRAWTGLVPILFGLGWYTLCALGPTVLHHHNLMGVGVASTLGGLVLFIFGWRAMKYIWFPMLYLFVFGQSISDRFMEIITFELQDIAAHGSYYGLSFMGLDVTRSGNTLDIMYNDITYPLNIAEACSGMRMLMAFLALGVAMAYTGLTYMWQRVILVLLAVPTAVFVNILRVMTLGLLSIADSGFAAGDFHTFVGTLWLIPAFLIYLGIVWILKNLVIEEGDDVEEFEPTESTIRFSGSATVGFVTVLVLLATSAVALQVGVNALNVYLHKEPVSLRKDFSVLPTRIDDWRKVRSDDRFDAAGVEALGTELYLSRVYVNEDTSLPPIQLHVAYYTGQVDAVPHIPDRCMVAGGFVPLTAEPITLALDIDKEDWEQDSTETLEGVRYPIIWDVNILTGKRECVRLPLGEFELRTTQFSHPRIGDDQVFAGYFFVANGKTTAYPERIRLLAFDRSSKYAYYCKVQFTIRGDHLFTAEQFNRIVSEFASSVLPEIMKCLPDWVEVTSPKHQTLLENQES